jgi:PAS domain S-box-containing protein
MEYKESLPNFKLDTFFNSTSLGIVYQDKTGKILAANKAAEEILGIPIPELLNRSSVNSDWQAIREDGSPFPGVEHPAMISLQTGKPVSNVVMGLNHPKKKSIYWILIQSIPEFNSGEDTPTHVYTTFTDITLRIEAEKTLKKEKAANEVLLSISNKFIDAPIEKMDEAINSSFELIGKYMDVDRVYLIEYDWVKNINNNTYEWCAEGIEPQIHELQEIPNDFFPDWVDSQKRGGNPFTLAMFPNLTMTRI